MNRVCIVVIRVFGKLVDIFGCVDKDNQSRSCMKRAKDNAEVNARG